MTVDFKVHFKSRYQYMQLDTPIYYMYFAGFLCGICIAICTGSPMSLSSCFTYIHKTTTLTLQKYKSSAVNARQAATTTERGLGSSLSRLLRNNTFEPGYYGADVEAYPLII